MNKIPDPNKMKRISGPRLNKRDLETAKVRITTYLDNDLLVRLKDMAHESGAKYQTLLNQLLRSSLTGRKEGLLARIDRLERAVFKKNLAA